MPYVDTEWAVVAQGALPGNESWANRWTVQETAVGADPEDVINAFLSLYTSWAGVCHEDWNLLSITLRNLVNGTVVDSSFVPVSGDASGANALPTECALRISLSAAPSRHGGPFLGGIAAQFADPNGQMSTTSLVGFTSALGDLFTDLVAADWALRLDSPSDTETKAITACRIGRTLDVIRRRRNQIPEGFITVPVAP